MLFLAEQAMLVRMQRALALLIGVGTGQSLTHRAAIDIFLSQIDKCECLFS
jgi:hypothetical protein